MADLSIHKSQKKILILISLVGLILAVKLSFALITNVNCTIRRHHRGQ